MNGARTEEVVARRAEHVWLKLVLALSTAIFCGWLLSATQAEQILIFLGLRIWMDMP